jgi:hypothetical protein
MTVRGVQQPLANPLLGTVGRPLAQPGDGAAVRPQPAGRTAPPPAALRPQAPLTGGAASLPAEAPPGTDPELWSVLTGEERAFFAKAAATGPLTYSRISAGVRALQGQPAPVPPSAGALRGGRLDVRG